MRIDNHAFLESSTLNCIFINMRVIAMHPKVQKFYSELTCSQSGKGSRVHEIEVSRGLHQIDSDPGVCALLDDGYEIADAARVYFSGKIHWIDVVIKVVKVNALPLSFVVTFDSFSNELISIARTNHNFAPVEGILPFALEVESHTTDVVATKAQMSRLETRRDLFTKALLAALLPVLGTVSPAAAASTTFYTSNTQSCTNKTTQSSRGTSGLTTPNDQDTRTDTSSDDSQDCHSDTSPDSRNDP